MRSGSLFSAGLSTASQLIAPTTHLARRGSRWCKPCLRERFDILHRPIARRRPVGVSGHVGMRGFTLDAREPTISTSRASRCATRVRDAEILEAVRAGHRACVASRPSSEAIALHHRHLTEPLHCVYRRPVTPCDQHHELRGDAALFSAPPPPILRGDTITTVPPRVYGR